MTTKLVTIYYNGAGGAKLFRIQVNVTLSRLKDIGPNQLLNQSQIHEEGGMCSVLSSIDWLRWKCLVHLDEAEERRRHENHVLNI